MSEIITIKEDLQVEGHFQQKESNQIEYRLGDRNYKAFIAESKDPRVFDVTINGKTYTIQITNGLDELISEMGLNVIDAKDAGDIFSPMPGLVLDVMVNDGEHIEEGQSLVILEAMKMENIIKSSGEGIIEKITISKGDKVEKGQLLITLKASE